MVRQLYRHRTDAFDQVGSVWETAAEKKENRIPEGARDRLASVGPGPPGREERGEQSLCVSGGAVHGEMSLGFCRYSQTPDVLDYDSAENSTTKISVH